MAACVGSIEPFDPTKPHLWTLWAERLEFYLRANGIADEAKKQAVLLSVCGSSTYEIVHSLVAPARTTDKTYAQLCAILKTHFSPLTSVIVCRFQFHKRDQKPDEPISAYIAELRKLAETCDFGTVLDDMLRDRLVCGVRDEALQRKLLAEPNLTFGSAKSAAIAAEQTAQNLREIRNVTTSGVRQVNAPKGTKRGGGPKATQKTGNQKCFRCGGFHKPETCKHKDTECRFCKKIGHIERVCITKSKGGKRREHVNQVLEETNTVTGEYNIFYTKESWVHSGAPAPRHATVRLEGKPCEMEVDSGAAFTIIGRQTFRQLWPGAEPAMRQPPPLRDYQGGDIQAKGICEVHVHYGSFDGKLPVVIVQDDRENLLGRNWFKSLGIGITGVHQAQLSTSGPSRAFSKYQKLFENKLGAYRGPPVSLQVNKEVPPKIMKARRVPFALKPKIDAEIDKLIEQGVLAPISHPVWATPVVPVVKPDGSVRLCGDYRVTINQALTHDPYPVPAVTHMFAMLTGGKYFAKLDLAQAYQQLEVDDESAIAQAIITHRGVFKVTRLQYGVRTAPGIFQRFMEGRLAGIPGVFPFYDDVLIVGSSEEELEARLCEVLQRFLDDGLQLKRGKSIECSTRITFLGYDIDKDGVRPVADKVRAIHDAPAPTDKTKLQAFLGMINFYHAFLKDKATVAEPLFRLLKKDSPWEWSEIHDQALQNVKKLLTSEAILVHYDEKKELVLTTDASQYGIGAVLSHRLPDETLAPIAFHSRTMVAAERNYSQLDKEALAVMAGIKKFHDYLYGRPFEIQTDHRPLLGLLGSQKNIETVPPRMQRWMLAISAYDFKMVYRPGKTIANADALSRLPLKEANHKIPPAGEVLMIECVPETLIGAEEISKLTLKDPILSRILNFILKGWPRESTGDEFVPFTRIKNELSAYKDCVLRGNRVIIPEGGRQKVLKLLHATHPGMVKMKAIARGYVWWPGMDAQIEKTVAACPECQQNQHAPPRAPIHPWEWTREPWMRLHVDHAGPYRGQIFLIVVDAHSKWVEVRAVPSTSSTATIRVLRELFATHGLPEVVVSDNGTSFTSQELEEFLKKNRIRHALVAPYHPASNGQAERVVQTTKDSLTKLIEGDWHTKLARFLLGQHTTPHSTTGRPPAELLMGRRLHTCLDKLHPDILRGIQEKQEKLVDKRSKPVRHFQQDEPVYIRNYVDGPKWVPATITSSTGPLSYRATTPDGRILHRHADQLQGRQRAEQGPDTPPPRDVGTNQRATVEPDEPEKRSTEPEEPPNQLTGAATIRTPRPIRQRKPPKNLMDYVAK